MRTIILSLLFLLIKISCWGQFSASVLENEYYLFNPEKYLLLIDSQVPDNEQNISKKHFSVAFGVGLSTLASSVNNTSGFPMYKTTISYTYNDIWFSLHYIFAREALETHVRFSHAQPLDKIHDISCYFGYNKDISKRLTGSLGSGIGVVNGVKRGEYRYTTDENLPYEMYYHQIIEFISAEIGVNASILFSLNSFMDLKLEGIANLNAFRSYAGATIALRINLPEKTK
jgi:hypothetical protein